MLISPFFRNAVLASAGLTLLLQAAPVQAAGQAKQPTICTRSCWAARAPSSTISQMSSLNRGIVHHTAGNEFSTTGYDASKSNVRGIQNYHMDTNGWSDIGYHFLVDKYGYIFEGRSGSMSSLPKGAHDGTNTNSFGFNIMGYFHPTVNNVPTGAMLDSLYDVIAWRMPSTWRPHGSPGVYGPLGNSVGYVDGHRRVKSTSCPGDNMFNPYMGTDMNAGAIRSQILSRINASSPPAKPGWYRDSDSSWHLRNTLTAGASDITAVYGQAGVIPVMGDWDGNGSKTMGWFRDSDSSWHLSNTNTGPTSNYLCVYGQSGCPPVVGDWDGDGKDSIGW